MTADAHRLKAVVIQMLPYIKAEREDLFESNRVPGSDQVDPETIRYLEELDGVIFAAEEAIR